MKKLAWFFLILFGVVVGGVVLLPKLVPMERVAAIVKERVRAETGRDMDFQGVTLVFWPNLGVEMTDVTLSNPAWAKEKNMLSLSKVNIALALKPLLQKEVEIKNFVLDAPVINLEVSAGGKRSWDFSKEKASADEKDDSRGASSSALGGAGNSFAFKFGQSQIAKGKLTFVDQQKGGSYKADSIDMVLTLPDLKSPLQLKGGLIYNKKHVDLVIDLVQPVSFFLGGSSPGHANLKTEDIAVKAAGVLATQGELFNGNVEADIASLPKFLAWVGNGKEDNLPFEKISFSSALRATKTDLVLKGADLTLDEVHAKGNMNIGFGGKPDIFARLSLNKLNLNRFTGMKPEAVAASGVAADKADKKDEGWDNKPIDMSALKSVNADLELKTEGFTVKDVDVGPSVLTATLQNGNLHFKSSEAALFGGKFSSDLNLNGAPSPPTMAFNFKMSSVQAKPVLTSFADFRKLSGAVDADVAVTSSGNSQKLLISRLNGNGSVVFKQGSLEGIDLLNIAKMVQKKLADLSVGEGKTDFVEMGGKFTINNGIISNSDLKMKGPLLQASGKGLIDLPAKYIQYRVTPVLTASSAVEGASGIAVPVDIKGPFSAIKAKPDFASVVQNVLAHPEDARATFKNVRDQIKTLKQNPVETLQNLFGGGGLFKKPAAPPAETPPASPAPAPQPVP